jgi:hypothetical protein
MIQTPNTEIRNYSALSEFRLKHRLRASKSLSGRYLHIPGGAEELPALPEQSPMTNLEKQKKAAAIMAEVADIQLQAELIAALRMVADRIDNGSGSVSFTAQEHDKIVALLAKAGA